MDLIRKLLRKLIRDSLTALLREKSLLFKERTLLRKGGGVEREGEMEEDGHGILSYIMEEDGLYYILSSTHILSSTYIVSSTLEIYN